MKIQGSPILRFLRSSLRVSKIARDAEGRSNLVAALARPVLLYRRSDLFQVAVSLALAAPEGVLIDLERVAEDALRDPGDERVVFVVKRIFGLDDMSREQHLELLGLGEGRQGMLPLDGRERRPGRLKLRFHGLDDRVKAGLCGGDGRDRWAAIKPVDGHWVAPR